MTKTTKTLVARYSLKLVREGSIRTDLESKVIDGPTTAASVFSSVMEDLDREHCMVMALDNRGRVAGVSTVSIGTLNASLVHPREVFKVAVLLNAAAIIVAHNHPSGEASPSPEDLSLTKRLVASGQLLGIPLHDHIVIGSGGRFTSLSERGDL